MDYAQRILAKLYKEGDAPGALFELNHADILIIDASVDLDEDEAGWLTEFMNRVDEASD